AVLILTAGFPAVLCFSPDLHATRAPIVAQQVDAAPGADQLHRPVGPVRAVDEAGLHAREYGIAVVHEQHGVVVRLDLDPLSLHDPLRDGDTGERDHAARGAEQAGECGEVVDTEVEQRAAALAVEPRPPARTGVPIA